MVYTIGLAALKRLKEDEKELPCDLVNYVGQWSPTGALFNRTTAQTHSQDRGSRVPSNYRPRDKVQTPCNPSTRELRAPAC